MSPLPSKSLIWSHEPITSSPEIAALGNFHQLPDATAIRCLKRYIAREVFSLINQRKREINQGRNAV